MSRIVVFSGGDVGPWRVRDIRAIRGEPLPEVGRLLMTEGEPAGAASWRLRGAISNARYATRSEVTTLAQLQPALARPLASQAVLIPIRKSPAWWALAQDERRAIFEETSHHTRIGLTALPAVARRLHHSRDLDERFDFLTWFEFAPEHEADFWAMTSRLRATREWDYVEAEVELRLALEG